MKERKKLKKSKWTPKNLNLNHDQKEETKKLEVKILKF
jgi:hypothetical protein